MTFWDDYSQRVDASLAGAPALAPYSDASEQFGAAAELVRINSVGEEAVRVREELFNADVRAFEQAAGKPYQPPVAAANPLLATRLGAAVPQEAQDINLRARALQEQAAAAGVVLDTDYETRTNAELKRRFDVDTETLARARPGFRSGAVEFAGSAVGFLSDPVNQATLVAGAFVGPGATLLRTMGTEAGINALSEAATLPTAFERARVTGREFGAAEALEQVALAGTFGAALPPALRVAAATGRAAERAAFDAYQALRGYDPEVSRALAEFAGDIARAPLTRVDDFYARKLAGEVAQATQDILRGSAPRVTDDPFNFDPVAYAGSRARVFDSIAADLDPDTAALFRDTLDAETSLYTRQGADKTQQAVTDYLAKRERLAAAYDINPDLIGRYEALTARRAELLEELKLVRETTSRSLDTAAQITQLNNRLIAITQELGQRKLTPARRAELEAERNAVGRQLDETQAAPREGMSQREAEVFYEFSQIDGLVRDMAPDMNRLWERVDTLVPDAGQELAEMAGRKPLGGADGLLARDAQELLRQRAAYSTLQQAKQAQTRAAAATGQRLAEDVVDVPLSDDVVAAQAARKPTEPLPPGSPARNYGWGAVERDAAAYNVDRLLRTPEGLDELRRAVSNLSDADLDEFLKDVIELENIMKDENLMKALGECKLG